MRLLVIVALAVTTAFALGRLTAQSIETSCVLCPADYISAEEIAEYVEVAQSAQLTDQQVRSIDIGKVNVQVALAHRGPLDAPGPNSVAEHDLVTEVYVVLSGGGTNRTGPDLVDPVRRPPDNRAVQFLNGPGHNAADIRNATTHELKAGDVFVIPAGTGHQFTRIEDHITYLMVRIDPDKVVPLLDAAGSRAYLDENL
ncbi:MAG TPA: AraC family ligand binding domain-containing protein [Gammaproteobacteria bacterium]|nr:AraC family ligand binding domain-containing protein [Gammaproteobacteria bacterium]